MWTHPPLPFCPILVAKFLLSPVTLGMHLSTALRSYASRSWES